MPVPARSAPGMPWIRGIVPHTLIANHITRHTYEIAIMVHGSFDCKIRVGIWQRCGAKLHLCKLSLFHFSKFCNPLLTDWYLHFYLTTRGLAFLRLKAFHLAWGLLENNPPKAKYSRSSDNTTRPVFWIRRLRNDVSRHPFETSWRKWKEAFTNTKIAIFNWLTVWICNY